MSAIILTWLPLALALVALAGAVFAVLQARQAKTLATPTTEMQRLAAELARPEGAQLVAQLLSQTQAQEGRLRSLESAREQVRNQLRGAVQCVGLKRFNAEEGVGGNLSFALALLDGNGSGLVVSSIYSRRESRIYAKQVSAGNASHTLSREEEEAIRQATAT